MTEDFPKEKTLNEIMGNIKRLNVPSWVTDEDSLAELPTGYIVKIKPLIFRDGYYLWNGKVWAEVNGLAWEMRFKQAKEDFEWDCKFFSHRPLQEKARGALMTLRTLQVLSGSMAELLRAEIYWLERRKLVQATKLWIKKAKA